MRDDMRLHSLGERYAIAADFLSGDVVLADEIATADNRTFRLVGRSSDMINIAGKRASLSGITRTLMDIEGVKDGVILMPDSADELKYAGFLLLSWRRECPKKRSARHSSSA